MPGHFVQSSETVCLAHDRSSKNFRLSLASSAISSHSFSLRSCLVSTLRNVGSFFISCIYGKFPENTFGRQLRDQKFTEESQQSSQSSQSSEEIECFQEDEVQRYPWSEVCNHHESQLETLLNVGLKAEILVGFGVILRRSALPRFHLLGFGVSPPLHHAAIPSIRLGGIFPPFRHSSIPPSRHSGF